MIDRSSDSPGQSLACTAHLLDGSPTVVLLHGLAANAAQNWGAAGWYRALEAAGLGWVAPDLRGHGASPKPHEPDAYRLSALVDDVVSVLDQRHIERADVLGYSLGAHVALAFATQHSDRVRRLVLGGIGSARALPRAAVSALVDRLPRGAIDRAALDACTQGVAMGPTPDAATVRCPVLLVAGADDVLVDGIAAFAGEFADARVVRVPGRNHLNVITAQAFKDAVLAFLAH